MQSLLHRNPWSGLLSFAFLMLLAAPVPVRADDWPQWLGPRRDGVWREKGILEKFPEGGPKVRWRTAIGAGYAGPAVAGDRVYVTDRILPPGVEPPKNPFSRQALQGSERILCLDDRTGAIVWKHEYDCRYEVSYPAGPRTTPVVSGGKVYALGTMGDLFCLEDATGKVVWAKNFPRDFQAKTPMWGFSASPLLDGDKLICLVGAEGGTVVAFHKDTGKELWRALSDGEIGYCPPTIVEAAGKRQLIIWTPTAVNGLDPETGKVYWSHPFSIKAGLTIPTPRQSGDLLFVTAFYDGSLMLKLDADKPGASVHWKGKSKSELPRATDGLHSLMCTPFLKDGYIYGVCSYGELRCLKADTGERVWQTQKATAGDLPEQYRRWFNAFLIAYEDRFFLFNENGDLISARLTPKGYDEIGRAHLLDATNRMVAGQRKGGASVLWSHPAFAHQSIYARNDKEIVRVSLAAEESKSQR